jgi:hypothetical protein
VAETLLLGLEGITRHFSYGPVSRQGVALWQWPLVIALPWARSGTMSSLVMPGSRGGTV